MQDVRSRIEYIDLLKGFGIVLMIIGHLVWGNAFQLPHPHKYLALYIYSFHMPLFFFISGYLYKCLKFKSFLKRKFKSLIIPYLAFGLFNLFVSYLLVNNFSIQEYFKNFLCFNDEYIGVGCAIWFLTALFFVNIIFWFLENISNKLGDKKNLILPILVFTVAITESLLHIKLPYSINCSLCVLPFFYLGTLFKQYKDRIKFKNILSVLFLTLPLITIFLNGKIEVRSNIYNNYFLFLFNALLTILGYWFIFEKIKVNKFTQILRCIGVNSLYYVCLNQVVRWVLFQNLGFKSNTIVLIITLIVISFSSELIKKFIHFQSNKIPF